MLVKYGEVTISTFVAKTPLILLVKSLFSVLSCKVFPSHFGQSFGVSPDGRQFVELPLDHPRRTAEAWGKSVGWR